MEIKTCQHCEKPFKVWPYRSKEAKFCSSICSGRSRLIAVEEKNRRRRLSLKKNPKVADRIRGWQIRNPEKVKQYKKKWRVNNRERINFLRRRRIYRQKNAVGTHSLEQVKKLFDETNGLCIYCPLFKPKKATTIDHVIPLSRGGSNDITNLLPACVSCNSKKSDKTLAEWNPMLFYQFHQLARHANNH